VEISTTSGGQCDRAKLFRHLAAGAPTLIKEILANIAQDVAGESFK
jgi:hypothetical protein